MDMTLREWLIIIGILVISGVVIDGYRRMRLARKRASELSFGLEEVKGYDEDFSSELPNGGARRTYEENELEEQRLNDRVEPGFSAVDDVPERQREEPVLSTEESSDANAPRHFDVSLSDELDIPPSADDFSESLDLGEPVPVLMNLDDAEHPDSLSAAQIKEETLTSSREIPVNSHQDRSGQSQQRPEKLSERPPASEVIVINVLARGGNSFDGASLLQSLLSSGMRFGDMAIFHRYANTDGSGKIQFSMANGVEPGIFDIDNLDQSNTPAVSFFMGMPGPENPMQAFTIMEETARQLALDLGGELKDEQFSVMTQQTLEHCRQRIREYERKCLTNKVSS